MSTMGSVWFSVIVLVTIQKALGNVCLKNSNDIGNCDECIRCGNNWCNERKSPHCKSDLYDGWCSEEREFLKTIDEINTPGVSVNPRYAERTLNINAPNRLDIQFTGGIKTKPKATMVIVNSTQNFNIQVNQYNEPKCVDMKCTMTIEAKPEPGFCSATGTTSEFVYVKINLGLPEEVLIRYHVPCACECSQKVDRKSKFCTHNGDFSCGVCSCYSGWTGQFCEKIVCPETRGDDVECSIEPRNDAQCNNNGYCGPCETCICYTDREGSQYFDKTNKCSDLCMVTGEYDEYLRNHTIGQYILHDRDNATVTFLKRNDSLTEARDQYNRKIWVSCNDTIDDCYVDYYAKKTADGHIYVMVKNHCNDANAVANVAKHEVPIILGVLAVIAAVAAVGGVMLWKHLNTVPPVPLNDPQYQNIDAEDCTGENPLYKPPTSSFKNPTYGKW